MSPGEDQESIYEFRADNHLGMEFDWFALTRDYCIYNSNERPHILTSKRVFVTPTLEVVR